MKVPTATAGTLLLGGFVLLIAGVIGGGISAFGVDVPVISSREVRTMCVGLGALAVAAALFVRVDTAGAVTIRSGSTPWRTAGALLAAGAAVATMVVVFWELTPPIVAGVSASASPSASPSPSSTTGVPNVYGMQLDVARPRLQSAGYTIGAIENVCSNSIRVSGIVRQVLAAAGRAVLVDEPPIDVTPAGRSLRNGSAVVLKITTGAGC